MACIGLIVCTENNRTRKIILLKTACMKTNKCTKFGACIVKNILSRCGVKEHADLTDFLPGV